MDQGSCSVRTLQIRELLGFGDGLAMENEGKKGTRVDVDVRGLKQLDG